MVQRETIRNRKLAVRFLAGTWCLTCFVLVTAYSSVLISFVTSPNYKPLVNSIYDLPKDTRIKMTVDKGLYPDVVFTVKQRMNVPRLYVFVYFLDEQRAEHGVFKYMGDQLRSEPDLRCSSTDQCLDRVRNGSTYVYTQVIIIKFNKKREN